MTMCLYWSCSEQVLADKQKPIFSRQIEPITFDTTGKNYLGCERTNELVDFFFFPKLLPNLFTLISQWHWF